jgi:tRNA(Ile)-lysidine synthase
MGHPPGQASFLAKLRATLEPHADRFARAPRVNIALSGGLDSSVALRAFAELGFGARLRALHVDHGLHEQSVSWRAHSERLAAALGIAFVAREVEVSRDDGRGLEAAARASRYSALGELIGLDDLLVTAHHADDQLETVLLRIARGAGVRGLGGIAELHAFGAGWLARPLLSFTRAELVAQARDWGLAHVEDPSNADTRFDRNFMRAEVLGALKRRWPSAPESAVRLARHMREAESNLEALAAIDLGEPGALESVPRERLRGLTAARQRNALRWLVRSRGLPEPDARQLETLRKSLDVVRPDAAVHVAWPGAEARVYDDRLYVQAPSDSRGRPSDLCLGQVWDGGALGKISFEPADERTGLPDAWVREGVRIEFRRGGERFKPLDRPHSRPLKQWLQEARIVPWMRDKIPLIYRGDKLVAVADLWLHDDLRKEAQQAPLWRVCWREHPPIH